MRPCCTGHPIFQCLPEESKDAAERLVAHDLLAKSSVLHLGSG